MSSVYFKHSALFELKEDPKFGLLKDWVVWGREGRGLNGRSVSTEKGVTRSWPKSVPKWNSFIGPNKLSPGFNWASVVGNSLKVLKVGRGGGKSFWGLCGRGLNWNSSKFPSKLSSLMKLVGKSGVLAICAGKVGVGGLEGRGRNAGSGLLKLLLEGPNKFSPSGTCENWSWNSSRGPWLNCWNSGRKVCCCPINCWRSKGWFSGRNWGGLFCLSCGRIETGFGWGINCGLVNWGRILFLISLGGGGGGGGSPAGDWWIMGFLFWVFGCG